MPRTRKTTIKIDYQELVKFRRTLPEYRRFETYRLSGTGWDITRALYILHIRPREPEMVNVEDFAKVYGFPIREPGEWKGEEPEYHGFFHVNTKTVMSDHVDLSRPLICALVILDGESKPGGVQIDGLHRTFKAAYSGIKQLQAFILTPEEEQACRV